MKQVNKNLCPLASACYPKRGQWLCSKSQTWQTTIRPWSPLHQAETVFRDDNGPPYPGKGAWLSTRPRVVVQKSSTLNHFSMQEQHLFSSASGGPHTGASALQKAGAASQRGSSPTGCTTTEPTLDLPSPYPSKVVSQPQICQIGNPSLVGNGDTSSTGLPKDKPSRWSKSSQTPVSPHVE